MQVAGICMGASNISIVKLDQQDKFKYDVYSRSHEGDVKRILENLIEKYNLNINTKLAVTGRKFKSLVNLPTISEPEATETAYNHIKKKYGKVDAIVSAGGETFMVYKLDDEGRINNVYTGNKCASGTGEFFFQQIDRMGLGLKQAADIASEENPYRVSGRCSVFCKSDCTHALNKGEDKGRIVAGLCEMMVNKIMELLTKSEADKIMLVGGTSNNRIMVNYLKNRLSRVIVPDEACYFEALGTALWGIKEGKNIDIDSLFYAEKSSFDFLPALNEYRDQVKFHSLEKDRAVKGDRCLLGLDVGSTTTKAVIIREKDSSLLASVYLRTEGDPVGASRKCYRNLLAQLEGTEIKIIGLGVTGSGRQIAGFHALTDSVINEIIAHATGAVYFDPEVDTIFEIGGQDAKYTYIVNKVPTDYAMNEACSAGTGSFLEESAKESLNIKMEDIAEIALQGNNPPNFSDQCAAFISSDIKNAIQEGIGINEICAGLVYSICMNYSNRVKGNREVGEKVFMQGGVCYNRAVPVAMAALTGKEIIVPPEPGLMGAFGVALVVKEHLELGLVEENIFDLKELASREVKYLKPFTCAGGKEKCDRKCKINVLEIAGDKYPFGGICNRYYNTNKNIEYDIKELDLVRSREKLIFDDFFGKVDKKVKPKGKVGINRSLTVNTFLPLFSNFFSELGYEVILPDRVREEGIQKQSAAFCYPVEVSHGYIADLLEQELDYIFLPHIKGIYIENGAENSVLCPLAQGEPYYLKAVWPQLRPEWIISPVLDFRKGYGIQKDTFLEIGQELGCTAREASTAYKKAVEKQEQFAKKLRNLGQKALTELEKKPEERAVVIFGRPYNALASVANMGIPHKFASRGEKVIPYDMLPLDKIDAPEKMYWSMGQLIMKGAGFVSKHPQLFGAYITNFSCGPDSFLVNYFRRESGRKPSLTLELDSHTADAGLDTRIEAFLDVVDSYLELQKKGYSYQQEENFTPARIIGEDENLQVLSSAGKKYSLTDDNIKLLIPSMGGLITSAFVAALNYSGVKAVACEPPGENELKTGRKYASGKECLPLQLTLGTLLNYLERREDNEELLVYFMPEASGPCRFGQYNVFMKKIIEENKFTDIAVLSLTASNSYAGLGRNFTIRAWQSVIIGDVLTQLYNSLIALAVDREEAVKKFEKSRKRIFQALASSSWLKVKNLLRKEGTKLDKIPIRESYSNAKKIALTGEIYVRNDQFSRQYLVEKLARKGIVTKLAPANEWVYYTDYLVQNNLSVPEPSFKRKLTNKIEGKIKNKIEKDVKKIMAQTGLCEYNLTDVGAIIDSTKNVLNRELTGEAILTIGGAITEIINEVDGIIALGPFGCMPNRIAESILSKTLEEEKSKINSQENNTQVKAVLGEFSSLPFLAIETDGNVFPQVIEARLEAFCLQVERINNYKNNLTENNFSQKTSI